jgi:hypothetical protein
MAEHFQFPVEVQIAKANRDAKRAIPDDFETPHGKALLHMELAVLNLIQLFDMPEQVLNTLPPVPHWFTYDQPVTADYFFDILQSEIGRKRYKLAEAAMSPGKEARRDEPV